MRWMYVYRSNKVYTKNGSEHPPTVRKKRIEEKEIPPGRRETVKRRGQRCPQISITLTAIYQLVYQLLFLYRAAATAAAAVTATATVKATAVTVTAVIVTVTAVIVIVTVTAVTVTAAAAGECHNRWISVILFSQIPMEHSSIGSIYDIQIAGAVPTLLLLYL